MNSAALKIVDRSWTLFLDRDGVINHENPLGYINSWKDFKMYDGVKEAFKIFSQRFGLVFIVTNQRGVSKGITNAGELLMIHNNLMKEISLSDGHIDRIYVCSDLHDSSSNRKPNAGMALQAKKDFPKIDFKKSIMIGNSLTDMGFGRNAGIAINIFLPTTMNFDNTNLLIDLTFPDLVSFAAAL